MKLLDLFACEGGASVGYAHAGWDVTAVDLDPNRLARNPYDAHVGDALDFLARHHREFDAVHASPPCQWYTRGNAARRGQASKWERTIPPVREALEATWRGLFECVPPRYTQHIGTQLRAHLEAVAA